MPASEADRLLAAGTTITVDGGERVVRFSLLALKRCEDAYGSLGATLTEVGWLAQQVVAGFPVPVAERLGRLLEVVTDDPAAVDAWSSPAECIDAVIAAWTEAFPPPDDPGKAEGATPTPRSPGPTGGASPGSTAR